MATQTQIWFLKTVMKWPASAATACTTPAASTANDARRATTGTPDWLKTAQVLSAVWYSRAEQHSMAVGDLPEIRDAWTSCQIPGILEGRWWDNLDVYSVESSQAPEKYLFPSPMTKSQTPDSNISSARSGLMEALLCFPESCFK